VPLQYIADTASLDKAAGIHDRKAITDFDSGADIMRDKDYRHAELALQLTQQQQDLDLYRHIERGGRFVSEQHARIAGQCQRDHRALAHATRHLMRVRVQPAAGGWDLHPFQQLEGPLLRQRAPDAFVANNGLGDLLADRKDRVERGCRLLKDHRGSATAQLLKALSGCLNDVLAVDHDAPVDLAIGRQEPHQGPQGHTLAATRLAENSEHFAASEAEADAVDRVYCAFALVKPDGEISDLDYELLSHRQLQQYRRGYGPSPEPSS
jgi:hypothetical protein